MRVREGLGYTVRLGLNACLSGAVVSPREAECVDRGVGIGWFGFETSFGCGRSPRSVKGPLASLRSRESVGDGNVVRSPCAVVNHQPTDRSDGFFNWGYILFFVKYRVFFSFPFFFSGQYWERAFRTPRWYYLPEDI